MRKILGLILFLSVAINLQVNGKSKNEEIIIDYLNKSNEFIGTNSDSLFHYLNLAKKHALNEEYSQKTELELLRTEGYYFYYTKKYKKGLHFCKQLIQKSEEYNQTYYLAFGYNNLSGNLFELGKVDSSIWAIEKAIAIANQNNYYEELTNFYQNYGNKLTALNNYSDGIEYYLKAINLREKHGFTEYLGLNNYLLGLALSEIKDYSRANQYLTNALEISLENKEWQEVTKCYNVLGLNSKNNLDTTAAIKYYNRAIEVGQNHNLKSEILPIYYNLGVLLSNKGKFAEAEELFKNGFELCQQMNFNEGVKFFSYGFISHYLKTEELTKIKPYLTIVKKEFNSKTASLNEKKGFFEINSLYNEKSGDLKNAFSYYKKFKAVSDTMGSNEQDEKILGLERKFAEEKLIEQNKVLSKDVELKTFEIEFQKNLRNILLGFLLVLLLIFGVIVFQYSKIKKLNLKQEKQKAEIEKQSIEIEIQNNKLKKLNFNNELYYKALSHDIKNQLAIIYGYCEIVEEDLKNAFERDIIETLKNSTLTANELIDKVLTKPNEIDNNIENVKLDHIVEKLLRENYPLINKKQIQVFKNYERHITLGIDKISLYRILQNLISNAIKYNSDQGEIIIEAKTENKKTIISVLDSGKGFSENELNKLFTNFRSLEATKVSKVGRSYGIGLIGVKELLTKLGGDISAKNRLDKKGAEVYFWL